MNYTNPSCGHSVSAGDQFCSECGQAVIGVENAETAPMPAQPQSGQRETYSAEISRQTPACLILLVNQSGSMAGPLAGGQQQKKEAAAEAINRLLYNIILACCKEDGVRHYFDIGVFGYRVDGEVQSVFNAELLSSTDIGARPKRTETRIRKVPDGAGGVYEGEFQLPVWLEPIAAGEGKASMNAAFERASVVIADWICHHPDSFPPVIINITDSSDTDQSPVQAVAGIQQQATQDGKVLVFNYHLSEKEEAPVVFPNDERAAGFQKEMKELYEASSLLPEHTCRWREVRVDYAIEPGARGCIFNADQVYPDILLPFLR